MTCSPAVNNYFFGADEPGCRGVYGRVWKVPGMNYGAISALIVVSANCASLPEAGKFLFVEVYLLS